MAESSVLSLLLLPGVEAPDKDTSIESMYEASIEAALLAASNSPHAKLDVAVWCPGAGRERNLAFDIYQHVLARVYALSCHICARHDIDPTKPSYVDFRVYLVCEEEDDGEVPTTGPVFSVRSLAYSPRKWSTIYVPESANEKSSINLFFNLRRSKHGSESSFEQVSVPSCSVKETSSAQRPDEQARSGKRHRAVINGGTFDNLHEGHKLLLSATALVLEHSYDSTPVKRRLIVGITGDQLLKTKKYAEMLESWDDRQKAVFQFLATIMSLDPADLSTEPVLRNDPGPNGKACIYRLPGNLAIELVEIQDPFGPTITEEAIDAIVVSVETRSGGKAVNDKRTEKGWAPLEVFEVEVLGPADSSDLKDKISSTEKRRLKLEASKVS